MVQPHCRCPRRGGAGRGYPADAPTLPDGHLWATSFFAHRAVEPLGVVRKVLEEFTWVLQPFVGLSAILLWAVFRVPDTLSCLCSSQAVAFYSVALVQ